MSYYHQVINLSRPHTRVVHLVSSLDCTIKMLNPAQLSKLSPGKDHGGGGKRRRSLSAIPPNRHGKINITSPYVVQDRLSKIPILPRPTKRSHLIPDLKKFMKGKSSLYSVAAALTRKHIEKRILESGREQCLLFSQSDMKEHVAERNLQNMEQPTLPKSLSVRLKVCRSSVAALIDDGFTPFKYSDFPSCILFIKIKHDGTRIFSLESFQRLVSKATLNGCTVAIFVGAWRLGGSLPMRNGLGMLYLSNGNNISGDAALALRVMQSLK